MKTIEQPKRMGRPPKPNGPISNRDRQQRWRDRVKSDADKLLAIISNVNTA